MPAGSLCSSPNFRTSDTRHEPYPCRLAAVDCHRIERLRLVVSGAASVYGGRNPRGLSFEEYHAKKAELLGPSQKNVGFDERGEMNAEQTVQLPGRPS
jgi:hypothetical protein